MFEIRFTRGAIDDLKVLKKTDRRYILDAVRSRLGFDPNVETRNRKRLRPNMLAEWELRLGRFRVFYDVEAARRLITIAAVGCKHRNRMLIGGKEFKL